MKVVMTEFNRREDTEEEEEEEEASRRKRKEQVQVQVFVKRQAGDAADMLDGRLATYDIYEDLVL